MFLINYSEKQSILQEVLHMFLILQADVLYSYFTNMVL